MEASCYPLENFLKSIVELLEIPPSYYQTAENRYRSLGEFLHHKGSQVARFEPRVCPQGSFRYGTVIRPLNVSEEYDLDLVCQLALRKEGVTQLQVKALVGGEITAYAEKYSFKDPPAEGNRCWTLDYSGDVGYHMDILPCIPEDPRRVQAVVAMGVDARLASTSIAITDRRHPHYAQLTPDWPTSNPRGLGEWFEGRMRPVALARMKHLVEMKEYRTIEEVPAYAWKTPLQKSIQILKRHRDVMFRDASEWAPISMILTVLAAQAYQGEPTLYEALKGIIDRMTDFVGGPRPRIPNPVNPNEDFTDRWRGDIRREQNFWAWHRAVQVDIARLPDLFTDGNCEDAVRRLFKVSLTADHLKVIQDQSESARPAIRPGPVVHIANAPRPWRR